MKVQVQLTKKQSEAWDILNDKETTDFLYGGAAGGGKSWLGCVWCIYNCLNYPGCRGMIGRAELKALKQSTLLTFFQICNEWGLVLGKDYKYNSIEGVINFSNTSAIYLKDLSDQPSDPEFSDLGSREYTFEFIDEGNEISKKAMDICKSRIRYKLKEFNLIPKILIASNPYKNFLYFDFYKPWRDGKLPIYRKFLQAFVYDNPHISEHYVESLGKMDQLSRERLRDGNWEYDTSLGALFDYDQLCEMFEFWTKEDQTNYYISVDVARFGKDKTVLIIWRGLNIIKIYSKEQTSTVEVVNMVKNAMYEYQISERSVIIDEDGVGGGVVDQLNGVHGFINGARPVELKTEQSPKSPFSMPPRHNFQNLKSQCYFLLADYVKNKRIGVFKEITQDAKGNIIEDLQQIKQKDPDRDGKLAVEPKELIKERLGRSTDFGDAIMMRMYLELYKKSSQPQIFI